MSLINEAKMPSLKDKIDAQEAERVKALEEKKAEKKKKSTKEVKK